MFCARCGNTNVPNLMPAGLRFICRIGCEDRRYKILDEVKTRRVEQIKKGKTPIHDDTHDPADWVTLLVQQIGKASNTSNDRPGTATFRDRMIDVAAIAVACIERIDRL
jgi:hypothetical protein